VPTNITPRKASAVNTGEKLSFTNLPHCCSTPMRLLCIGLGGLWMCRSCRCGIGVDAKGVVTEPANRCTQHSLEGNP
jgi:hypothetical protein